MEGAAREDVKDHCIQALANVGAPVEFCNFYADVLQCEYDMTHTIYRMQKDLREELVKQPIDSGLLFSIVQNMTKKFYCFKTNVDGLSERGSSIPPLKLNPDGLMQTQHFKALCSLETKEMNLQEGEDLVVTDMTRPNRLRVRNSRGDEGYVPALCCILPTPDNNAITAVERLQVHLLTSWTECVRKVKSLLFDNLMVICKIQSTAWNDTQLKTISDTRDKDRVCRRFRRLLDAATLNSNGVDLNKLHKALFSLEKELITLKTSDLNEMIGTIANLDRAVLCYQNLYKQWRSFRHDLREAPRPIRLVQQLDQLRQIAHGQNFNGVKPRGAKKPGLVPSGMCLILVSYNLEPQDISRPAAWEVWNLYYEMKMTLEDYEVMEEITYVNKTGETVRQVLRGGSNARHQALGAEQLTSSSQEEKKRFIIQAVVDPRNGAQISMHEAVVAKIVDPETGMYCNPDTGEGKAIPVAMSEGLIIVEYVSTKRTVEKTKAVGLITLRTEIDRREYSITGAIDALTAERVDANEARTRGLVNENEGYFLIGTTGEKLPLLDAIDQGWVFAIFEEETGEAEVEVNTYAVSEVADQFLKKNVTFSEAVRRGLIERETGCYVNNVTKERIDVVEAIQQGLLKARLVKDAEGLNISTANAVVVDRIDKIRRNVLKGLRVVNAFKQSAQNKT